MKTKKLVLTGILGIALSGFVLTGCHKSSTSPDTDITAAEDESNASNISADSKNVSDAAMSGQSNYGARLGGIEGYTSHCSIKWSIDTSVGTEDTMYIIFPSSPTPCNDGRYREGEILVYWNNKTGGLWKTYFDSTGVVNMTFRNYAVGNSSSNMIEVNGTRQWTNNGGEISYKNINSENWSFSANLTLTYLQTGKTATWNSSRTNTLVYEGGVWYYKITGSASGTCQSGASYTITITQPLYHTAFPWWLGGCPWIESGQVTIVRSNRTNTLTITFGTLGNCSDQATAEIAGNSYTVYMN